MTMLPLIKPYPNTRPIWVFRIIGFFMISHFLYLTLRCVYENTLEDTLWVSHVGTLIGGIGAVWQNRVMISIAVVALVGHHSFWLIDTLTWLITGSFPFGTTTYLTEADIFGWLKSSNHFFSMPLLLILVYYQNGIKRNAWLGASLLFTILAVLSFFISPEVTNVNSVHHLWPGLDRSFLAGLDNLPPALFVGSIILLNTFANYLPGYFVLAILFGVDRNESSSGFPSSPVKTAKLP